MGLASSHVSGRWTHPPARPIGGPPTLLLLGLPELHVYVNGSDLSALPVTSQDPYGAGKGTQGPRGLQGWAAWDAVAVAGTKVPPQYRRRSRALASRGELSTEGGKVRVVVGYGHDPQCR